jgi:hypothetical protein
VNGVFESQFSMYSCLNKLANCSQMAINYLFIQVLHFSSVLMSIVVFVFKL